MKEKVNKIVVDPTKLNPTTKKILTQFLHSWPESRIDSDSYTFRKKTGRESKPQTFVLTHALIKTKSKHNPSILHIDVVQKFVNPEITKVIGTLNTETEMNFEGVAEKIIKIDPRRNLSEETKQILADFIDSYTGIFIQYGIYKFQRDIEKKSPAIYIQIHHSILKSTSRANPRHQRLEIIKEFMEKGNYGNVYKTFGVIKVENNMAFHAPKKHKRHVVKTIPITHFFDTKRIKKEAYNTQKCSSSLHCHDALFNEEYGFIIMRRIEGIDWFYLTELIHQRKIKISLLQMLQVSLSAMRALNAIHQRKMLHRDIKLENTIINLQTLTTTFIDFDFACDIGKTFCKVIRGSYPYIAPEAIDSQKISPASDIFALGQSLAAFWGNTAFDEFNDSNKDTYLIYKRQKEEVFYNLFKGMKIPRNIAAEIEEVLADMCRFKEAERSNLNDSMRIISQLIEHVSSPDFDQELAHNNCFLSKPMKIIEEESSTDDSDEDDNCHADSEQKCRIKLN